MTSTIPERRTVTSVAALALLVLPLTMGASSGCVSGTQRDQGTVSEVRVAKNPKGDGGVARTLVVRIDSGRVDLDGPYLTLAGIGHCKVGSRWPSCLTK